MPTSSPSSDLTVLVQSHIRPSSLLPSTPLHLPTSTFHKWYSAEHIPDLLALPDQQVRSAFRYVRAGAAAAEEDEIELNRTGWPYLAVYPRLSEKWFKGKECEFLRVPVEHEMLPGGGGERRKGKVFVLADFEIAGYRVLGTRSKGGDVGMGKFVVVVPVGEGLVKGEEAEEVLEESFRGLRAEGVEGKSVLLEYDFSPVGKPPRQKEVEEEKLLVGAEFIILHHLNAPPTNLSEQWGKQPQVWNLVQGFGDISCIVE